MLSNGIQNHFKTASIFYPQSRAYNIILAVRIEGKLDVRKFCDSLQKAGKRITDIRIALNLYTDQCFTEEEALAGIRQVADLPLDADEPERIEACLFKLTESCFYFCAVQHHTGIDLHSKELLSRLISSEYNGKKLDIQLIPYTEAGLGEQDDKVKRQEGFWRKYLENPPDSLVLPPSRSSRDYFTGEGNTFFFKVNENTNTALQQGSERELQPFLHLLTSYALLLNALSGQLEFFIGVPFPNRRNPERENMYGPFVNILPLKVTINPEESFLHLYNQIRKDMLLLHRNQELPFLEIAGLYKGSRDPRIPYFLQAGFTREEPFMLNLDGCSVTPINIRPEGAQMDLFLTYWDNADGLSARIEFNTSAFTQDQAEGWSRIWQNIVAVSGTKPETVVKDLPLIMQDQLSLLKYQNNERTRKYPLEIPFREHLLSSYSRYGSKIALTDEEQALTYKDLERNVRNLSQLLKEKAGRGRKILVALDNSLERLTLIHAIVVSGNAYVPVDPNWPVSRVEYIFSNSGAVFGIIEPRIQQRFQNTSGLFTPDILTAFVPENQEQSEISDHETIAVLYTSGSTGNPKGVAIPGQGMVNRLWWMQETFPLAPGDTLIHKVPYTFDVSMWEIFWPFLFGASLFIPEQGRHLDDVYLADTVREQKISYIHFVPSLLRKFLDNAGNFHFPDLKGIICSGEALDVSLVRETGEKTGGVRLHNLYGPTEASIDVTAWECTEADLEREQIPIGRPIANTRILVLDKYRRLCSSWVRGEIAIAGVNVSPGYINNPELTEKAFIRGDWGWGQETVYCTGDIGYYDNEGVFWYSGRMDTQVKINGIRIELAEIERNLETIDSVSIAVVLIPEKSSGDMTLHAYLAVKEGENPSTVKTELIRRLPGYMIPDKFHFIDTFPMLPSGKIDRKALAAGNFTEAEQALDSHSSEKMTDIFSGIEKIWCELLNVPEVDSGVSFFDLGGHSLQLPVLQKKLQGLTGKSVSLMDLFRYPTVAAQAALIGGKDESSEAGRASVQREQMKRMAGRNRRTR